MILYPSSLRLGVPKTGRDSPVIGDRLQAGPAGMSQWRKQWFGHPQHMTLPQPSSVTPFPKCPSNSSKGRRAGSHPAPSPNSTPSIASLPSKPLLFRHAGPLGFRQSPFRRGRSPSSQEQSRLDLPPDTRKPWTDHSSCSPTQPRQGQELCGAKIKKSPGLPISYIYQPATAPSGTKVFKHWKESA